MLLSIVTGTYNRLPMLQAMIASVRSQMPRHLGYEFCITDCGSTDGTVEWLETQPDVCLLKQHERRGAIKQFGDAARMAQGEYVIMANDDIEFYPYSILRAVAHLESTPTCGGVGFADNRSQKLGRAATNQVEQMPATLPDGTGVTVNYGQVCMVRRWLGEAVGWWGDRDEVMRNAFTYGGDNYLSARIWELGYTIDAVPGCLAEDKVARDGTRDVSNQNGKNDGAIFRQRFPRGAMIPDRVQAPNPQEERLRILVADIHEPALPARAAKERGLAEAFADVGLTWHVDYINEDIDLPTAVAAWQPHLIFTQMQGTDRINAEVMRQMREAKPDAVIVNFNGDAHERGLIGPDILEALRYVDLQTVVNAKVLGVYREKSIPAAYWQIGWKQEAEPYPDDVPAHDILLQMNCYNDERRALLSTIRAIRVNKRRPDIGVYGNCPGSIGYTHYSFAHQAALNRAAKIVIGDTYFNTEAFVSNRLFQVLGAGGFLLQQTSLNLDAYTGLQAGVHYVEWTDLKHLTKLIKFWLRPEQDEARHAIAEAGMAFVRANYSYEAQVDKLWGLLA